MMMFEKVDNRLVIRGGGEIILLEPYGGDCLRFRSTGGRQIVEEDWTLLRQPGIKTEIYIQPEKAVIKNGRIKAEVYADGSVRYLNDEDKEEKKEKEGISCLRR